METKKILKRNIKKKRLHSHLNCEERDECKYTKEYYKDSIDPKGITGIPEFSDPETHGGFAPICVRAISTGGARVATLVGIAIRNETVGGTRRTLPAETVGGTGLTIDAIFTMLFGLLYYFFDLVVHDQTDDRAGYDTHHLHVAEDVCVHVNCKEKKKFTQFSKAVKAKRRKLEIG